MKPSNELYQKQWTQLTKQRLDLLKASVRVLEQQLKEAEAPKTKTPWEPKRNGYVVLPTGQITNKLLKAQATVGFETCEAAEKASKWFTFYQRLYKLAEEMNAKYSAEDKQTCHMYWHEGKWLRTLTHNPHDISCLFTAIPAAQEACDIMNRDGWVLPTEMP